MKKKKRSGFIPMLQFTLLLPIMMISLLLHGHLVAGESRTPQGNVTDDDEIRLINELLSTYNKEVRPVKNHFDAVQLKFGIAISQLIDLDEKNQVLISNIWIRMHWNNHFLKWNKTKYGDIESVNISPHLLWLPDIVLSDNAHEFLGSGQIDQYRMKVKLNYDGSQSWYVPTILKSQCAINVQYFPFDDQKCNLTFSSWAYNGNQVNITNKEPEADLAFYLESGEFDLLSAKATFTVKYYSCCVEPYPEIQFTIHIQRKALFYLNNLVIPCVILTCLGLFTFVLPPACGERITLVITTFLAMTVFMLSIAENTPSSSNASSLIGMIILSSISVITLSLVTTCFVLNLYEGSRPVEDIPKYVKVFLLDYLSPFLWITPPRKKHFQSDTTAFEEKEVENDEKIEYHQTMESAEIIRSCGQAEEFAVLPTEISLSVSVLASRQKEEERYEKISDEWSTVAKIFDRVFLVLFLCVLVITGAYILVTRPVQSTLL